MRKLFRFLNPVMPGCLPIGIVFYLTRVSHAEAVGLNRNGQGNMIVTTLEDELNVDGDRSGIMFDEGHNLDSDGTCGLDPANGSIPNTDPLLGPLQDNGGATYTHALLTGSPATDTGDNDACPSTDQRMVNRPQDGNEDGIMACDIGSYEKIPPTYHNYLSLIAHD